MTMEIIIKNIDHRNDADEFRAVVTRDGNIVATLEKDEETTVTIWKESVLTVSEIEIKDK